MLPAMDGFGFRTETKSILQDDKKEIIGITKPQLIDIVFELTPIYRDLQDGLITRSFWRTYYLFISPLDLVTELIGRLRRFPLEGKRLERVDEIVRCWVKFYLVAMSEEASKEFTLKLDKVNSFLKPYRSPSLPDLAIFFAVHT